LVPLCVVLLIPLHPRQGKLVLCREYNTVVHLSTVATTQLIVYLLIETAPLTVYIT
jgi:hypothetical protein